jgi:hypothetical protein
MYITRLVSNEIFSPSNKIHREVGRDKELSAPRYISLRSIDGSCHIPYSHHLVTKTQKAYRLILVKTDKQCE